MSTIQELKDKALEIKDATRTAENTAMRVGGLFEDIVDYVAVNKGPKGDKGDKGDAFTYEDFTEQQLASLTGPQGPQGPKGDKGDPGESGATDKPYDPVVSHHAGMGIKVLQLGKGYSNLLTTRDFDTPNTIYIIQYDFDLGSYIVMLPADCILLFLGGSLSNGTITGNNTCIEASFTRIFGTDITLNGSWHLDGMYSEWFGAKADGNTDSTVALQKAIDNVFSINDNVPVRLLAGVYNISASLNLHQGQHISIKGLGDPHLVTIKATAQMTGMIRYISDGEYDYTQNVYISGFTLDGNRASGGNERLASTPALATDGILIGDHDMTNPSCMIYSEIKDMLFLNIDGFAISIAAWATHIHECGFGYCENGIFGYSGNGLVIERCGFNYMTKVGTHNGGYGIVIRDNIYDVLGHCAIIISSESKALIDGNYFEETSINGINMYSALLGSGTWYPSQTSKIHPVIYAGTGTGTLRSDWLLKDPVTPHEYGFGRGFASQVTVINNYLDSPETADNRFFVFGSALMSAKITDNICRDSDNQRYAFGTILDPNCSLVHDVEISRNWNFGNPNTEKRPMPRFGGIQGPYVYWSDCWCYNIYTNDDTEDPSLDGDIVEKCIFRIANAGVIEEVDQKYLGRQVFYCDGCVDPNETMAVYLDVPDIDGHVVFDPSVYANKTIEVSYYRKAYDSDTWEHVRVNGCYGLARVWVVFPEGKGYITLPTIRVAGSRQVEGIAVHRPIAYGNSCTLEDKHITYLPGTELRLKANDYARRAYIESNENGGYNHVTTNIRVETDMPQIEPAGLTALAEYPRAIRGMTAVNSDNSKPVWFDGSVWRYYDGTAIA